ncbi:hypothetical protein [Cohnella thailandensis]|uniref:Glycosyltransferase n=1 Tax=Cohnella thailandensis TaxID=557557 RepID=A0A841T7Q7_9BACL|nr:hypothetical protein [Cohnella thailandensis]MBB6637887.1 hypothetical protein [Cohnella thailandensis]MBP1977405.1 hypothetical protein [Cohnella thailandensis]
MSSDRNVLPRSTPSFIHLRRLTDDTGLIEHALGRIPRRREGYTTDDNARALWTVTEWLSPERSSILAERDRILLKELADIYLAFLLWTQKENGWFHNNVAYDRTLEPEDVSHDCQGRAVWSCADAWIRLEGARRDTAFILLQHSLQTIGSIRSHRGQAFALATCSDLLSAHDSGVLSLPEGWKEELTNHLYRLEGVLLRAFSHSSADGWKWFEPSMTYGNGVLPWALLRAFRRTENPEALEVGLDSLSSLRAAMSSGKGGFRPIGNEKWRTKDTSSRWDQQPLEMFKLALAFEEAAKAIALVQDEEVSRLISVSSSLRPEPHGASALGAKLTDRTGHPPTPPPPLDEPLSLAEELRLARDRCLDWFYGDNDLLVLMVDPEEGACSDGLQQNGPNMNCGAEATISFLMTQALCCPGTGGNAV